MAVTPACIFCGGKPTTIEDIFPKWLHRYLGNPPTRTITIDKAGTEMDLGWPALAYTAKARITCRPCNNEFVSGFDTDASPLLKKMFDGNFTGTLDRKSRGVLARWTMKMALLMPFIHADPGQGIPQQVYHDFYAWRNPPRDRVLLLMGQYRADAFPRGAEMFIFQFRHPGSREMRKQGKLQVSHFYGLTFFIQNLVWQVLGIVEANAQLGASPPPEFLPFVIPVLGPGSVRWPPPQTFDDAGLIRFSRVFGRFPSSP